MPYRGGGDLGRYWYQEGKLLQKNHTFDDVTAAAEFLIQVGPALGALAALAALGRGMPAGLLG